MPGGSINFTDDEINKLLDDVHKGKIHLFNLPKNVYNRVAEELTSTVFEAFNLDAGTSLINPDFETPRQLKRNLYVFSAAKTFKQVEAMQAFIFNEKGLKRSFNEFKQFAEGVFNTFNVNWLEAEYETSIRQAEAAAEWERLQSEAEIFPLLRYKTLEDGSVRDEHITLNNIVRPANDVFWDRFQPPNGWRCRCFIEQLEEGEAKETPLDFRKGGKVRKKVGGKSEEITQPSKLFDFNPAKEGVIFREDAQGKGLSHPYFKVDQRWDIHKRNNFGLPLPPDVAKLKPLPTIGKQKVKITTAKPTPLKTTPITPTKPPTIEERLNKIKEEAPKLKTIEERAGVFGKQIKDINTKLVANSRTMGELIQEGGKRDEIFKIRDENRRLREEILRLQKEIDNVPVRYAEDVLRLLRQDTAATFNLDATKTLKDTTPWLAFAKRAFAEVVGDRAAIRGRTVPAKISRNGRAYYSPSKKSVFYDKGESVATIAHELGHWLEDFDSEYFDKIKTFYARRTKGDPIRRMRDITGNRGYKLSEITKEDKFINPYTGRVYEFLGRQYATEVTSMWFTHAFEDLGAFIKNDFEHFEFIFKRLNE